VGWLGQQAGWASRPDGPNWLWPIDLNQNSKFKFKCYFLFGTQIKFKNSNNINKTLSQSLMN
jgi:hypothetical protein